jgi:hypothetical protein
MSICGLMLGIIGDKSSKRGKARAGIVMSLVGLVATIKNSAIGAYLGSTGQLF